MKKLLHKKTGKRALMGLLTLLAGLFFIACTKDIHPGPQGPQQGQATVVMNLKTPKPTLPGITGRAQTESETRISAVKVLVFEQRGGNYIFSYFVSGSGIAPAGEQTQFRAYLIGEEVPLKLLVLTNSDDVFTSADLQPGDSEAVVREKLNRAFTADGMTGELPMYGELTLPGGLTPSETYTHSITVLRAVARVDVVKELLPGSADFILEEVYAFRANNSIQLIPDAIASPSTPKVSTPSIPDGATFLIDPVKSGVPGGTESIIQLYLPESEAVSSNPEKLNGATTLVVGGRYGGAGGEMSYYRVNFNSGLDGHPFGQILRNYRYIFNIKQVTSDGWPTPGQAADNIATSMEVDVLAWEDFSSEMYFGDHHFGISSRDITLRYVRNREKRLDVESTLTYEIQWLETGGTPVGSSTSSPNVTISNENFDVTIVQDPGDGEEISHLVFRPLNDNHAGAGFIESKLRITVANWTADITVRQEYSGLYNKAFYRILSVEEVGNLGLDQVASGASGMAMRQLLDAQFAPAGVIRVGGFSYTRIPNSGGYVGTSTAANLAVLERIFGAQDVIYLPNNVGLSNAVADLLLAWLAGSDHRVLIVGTDSGSTNINLRSKLTEDGTWINGNINSVTNNFKRSPASADTEYFFAGPFGVVSDNAAFNRQDDTAGYNTTYPSSVTPLISADPAGRENYMFFGVNQGRRIVYHGDAQLFMIPQMSNNSGAVNTELDRLMGNLWAWIIEQVIYGDD